MCRKKVNRVNRGKTFFIGNQLIVYLVMQVGKQFICVLIKKVDFDHIVDGQQGGDPAEAGEFIVKRGGQPIRLQLAVGSIFKLQHMGGTGARIKHKCHKTYAL